MEIKNWIKRQLRKRNIVAARFDKTRTDEQTFSCHLRLDEALIGKRLFGGRLGVLGYRRNSFSLWLERNEETGKPELRYLLRDNGYTADGSMHNGYEEFLEEGDVVKLQFYLYREEEDKEFAVDIYVSHPRRDDSRDIEFLKGYSSTGFHYHLKANPKCVIVSMTKLGEVDGLKGINYTKSE